MIRDLSMLVFLGFNAWEDWRKRKISLTSIVLASFIGALFYAGGSMEWTYRQILAFLPGAFLLLWSYLTRGKVGIGDGLIVLEMGLYMPLDEITAVFSAALMGAAVYSGILYMKGHRNKDLCIPFVPFLLGGYVGGLCLWTR